jgi:xylulokinase
MFLSPLFREAFVNMNEVTLELYDTDGSQGAARGAGIGVGIYSNEDEAFQSLSKISALEPGTRKIKQYKEVYAQWLSALEKVKD